GVRDFYCLPDYPRLLSINQCVSLRPRLSSVPPSISQASTLPRCLTLSTSSSLSFLFRSPSRRRRGEQPTAALAKNRAKPDEVDEPEEQRKISPWPFLNISGCRRVRQHGNLHCDVSELRVYAHIDAVLLGILNISCKFFNFFHSLHCHSMFQLLKMPSNIWSFLCILSKPGEL
ncbi:hypothetical protein Dimus_011064, partial [Dionaea muscipula]